MNILVFENRGSVVKYLREALGKLGHDVFHAFSVYDAQSFWKDERIDCLLVDLNIDPEGLEDDEIKETLGGLLTGWIWLREHVYKKDDAMKRRTIIYTEYSESLTENVSSEELDGIYLVPKRGSASSAQQVIKHVETIAGIVGKASGD